MSPYLFEEQWVVGNHLGVKHVIVIIELLHHCALTISMPSCHHFTIAIFTCHMEGPNHHHALAVVVPPPSPFSLFFSSFLIPHQNWLGIGLIFRLMWA